MKRSLLAIFLAASFVLTSSITTLAIHDTDSSTVYAAREQEPRTSLQESTTDDKRMELEARKTELEQKLSEKRAAISNKLMGVRAEKCQKKEININAMLDKRVESAQKHFDTFKSIHTRLTTLVKEKEITIENQNARQIIINGYEIEAQAAIDDIKNNSDFKCGEADAAAPGAIVKSQISTVKQALKDYRDSIKDFAQTIKASVEKPSETTQEEDPATVEAPVEETPSTEQSIEGVQQ